MDVAIERRRRQREAALAAALPPARVDSTPPPARQGDDDLASAEEAIGEALNAGTNCGSCVPELKRIVAEVQSGALD